MKTVLNHRSRSDAFPEIPIAESLDYNIQDQYTAFGCDLDYIVRRQKQIIDMMKSNFEKKVEVEAKVLRKKNKKVIQNHVLPKCQTAKSVGKTDEDKKESRKHNKFYKRFKKTKKCGRV